MENPLLGFVKNAANDQGSLAQASPGKSTAEIDLQERSTKKVKENINNMHGDPVVSGAEKTVSFRDIMIGQKNVESEVDMVEESEDEEALEVGSGGIMVEEKTIRGYECPSFIFSEAEEKRIQKRWRRGVIVKLLGRKIGYKALETRLNQMWVRKGVISIIDLSNDYYLVAFSHEDDKKAALGNGPWFIYDHYLTVKDWRPNFQPNTDSIDEVAVWVRIYGLPIEYYDPRALTVFGNRIGRTIKVDKTTIKQERGKYARICVTVNLAKPLLAMFDINGSYYKIEFKVGGEEQQVRGITDIVVDNHNVEDGPWRIVQKPRRTRKTPEGRKSVAPAKINDGAKVGGSRFHALIVEDSELMGNDTTINVDNSSDIIENYNNYGLKLNDKGGVSGMKNVDGFDGVSKRITVLGKEKNLQNRDVADSLTDLDLNKEQNDGNINGKKRVINAGDGGRRHVQNSETKRATLGVRGGIQVKEK
ncbi:uncharacterized protein LOC131598631 [Vicia villosa]|uniref:uncharacterized protein LOC131598631 n=1 Tax=Vicia villosa TaxID=3911 RepID=UPI00273C4765|nr:uncharacterized protein LOC131598631 [Vicia villosa]